MSLRFRTRYCRAAEDPEVACATPNHSPLPSSRLPCSCPSPASAAPPSNLARALADPGRAAQRGTDARRHPAELVALADLKPGQRILDLIPGDGYWTRIFSKMVGPRGRVYAVWPQAYAREATGNIQQLQGIARQYGNVTVQVQPSTALTAPELLDVVWTADNYHDYNDKFMGSPGSLAFARSAFRILKPGGLFIVIDHAAAARPRRPRHREPAPDRARGGECVRPPRPGSGWSARARCCAIPKTR